LKRTLLGIFIVSIFKSRKVTTSNYIFVKPYLLTTAVKWKKIVLAVEEIVL